MKIETDITDLITVEQDYIKNISTENTILRIVANGFLTNERVPQDLKNKIIENVGKRWFNINENNIIFWNDKK